MNPRFTRESPISRLTFFFWPHIYSGKRSCAIDAPGDEQVVRWTTWELLGNLTAVEDGLRLALLDLLARRGGGSRPNLEEVLADETVADLAAALLPVNCLTSL